MSKTTNPVHLNHEVKVSDVHDFDVVMQRFYSNENPTDLDVHGNILCRRWRQPVNIF